MAELDAELPEELWTKKHRSYFIWEYGKLPEVVIEIVSNRKGEELGIQKQHYARIGIAYYVVFDPATQLGDRTLHLFERRGTEYARMRKPWLPVLGLGMTLWEGEYEGQQETWLRWCDQEGNLILTGAEASQQERERAARLAAQLRELGIEPEA